MPLWVSVGGFSADDYAGPVRAPRRPREIASLELNVSCPNVAEPAESAAEIVAAARAATRRRSTRSSRLPSRTSPRWRGRPRRAGADGLSLVNTIRGLALDARTLAPVAREREPAATPARRSGRSRSRRSTPPTGDGAADRRHGRRRDGPPRARADRRRRDRGRASERCCSPTPPRRPASATELAAEAAALRPRQSRGRMRDRAPRADASSLPELANMLISTEKSHLNRSGRC